LNINFKKAEELFYKGISEFKKLNYTSAKDLFTKANSLYPNRESILKNLALTNIYLNNFNDAFIYADKLFLQNKRNLETIDLLVIIFSNFKKKDDGIIFFKNQDNLDKDYLNWALANLYHLNGEINKSEELANKIIKNNKNFYKAYYLIALIKLEENFFSRAIIKLKEALKIKKNFYEAFFLLGKIYKKLGNIKKAKSFFDKALTNNPENLKFLLERFLILPVIYDKNHELDLHRKNYFDFLDKLLIEDNRFSESIENVNLDNQSFYLSYSNFSNLDILKKKIKTFKKIFPELALFNYNNKSFNNSKIKIGFISEFLTDHTIGKLFSELILNIDKKNFEIIIFHSHLTKDGGIKKKLDINIKRVITLSKSFQNNINKIREEHLDILFYTDIGMSSDLYYLTFLKLAKCQITSLGHPETTGNPNIDFFVSNKLSETSDSVNYYSEKLELFNQFNVYCSPPAFKKKKFNFNYSSDFKFYSCPQSLFKILPDFDIVISKILNEDKKAIIFFIKDNFNYWFRLLKIRFQKNISKDHLNRVIFLNRLSTENFINLCGSSNVLLDPLYFGAGNSFIETLNYGTPYITFPGTFLRSRIVLGIYKQMNISNAPIATSLENYAELAMEYANNKLRNEELRNEIISNSKKFFFNNQKVLQEYEAFFKRIVN